MNELPSILGEDPLFLEAMEHVSRLAPLEKPCLVIGERGTGKELVATRLHYLSRRWDGPLVKVNCAALSETLLESELFGHEEGAFTNARRRHHGRFERADGGTLFLDEIATASNAVQEKLLRVIEYGTFERVGGHETVSVDVRIVGATNDNLRQCVRDGNFRADLLDRLAFDVVTLPPLRLRHTDILPLAETFAMDMTKQMGMALFPGFSDGARQQLLSYDWPGNVREMKNVIERAVYLHTEDAPISQITFDPFQKPWQEEDAAPQVQNDTITFPLDFTEEVARKERHLLQKALEQARYNQTEAAGLLGLNYNQTRRLLKKHQLI
ncbi:phage shock protein operon transcriptional activator [Aestuariispira ectoiniformans]|uniref:phage shock protein operon transcriptional activator n=1 Tax=Aestuariispira ectoiniformans TaxID=2775080 RepID=UPI00223B56F0|nr:phage shock protein operon transcriptional activator [Aestuariispira ectoiniformans]